MVGAGTTEDIPFYVGLAQEADGPVVELAVGTGRVAVPVAKALGRRCSGSDRSPAMLAKARRAADEAGVQLELREGDARASSTSRRRHLLARIARCCTFRPGPTAGGSSNAWPSRSSPADGLPGTRSSSIRTSQCGWTASRGRTDSETLWEYVAHRPQDNRIDITAYVGEPGLGRRDLQLWWVTRSEWEGLIDVAGLEVEALYGWFDKAVRRRSAVEFVWVARKP